MGTNSFSQKSDTTLVSNKGNNYYHITRNGNSKILIFLHGGVKNPIFDDFEKIHDLNFLLEDNKLFVRTAVKNGFDVLVPITNDSLNWLSNHEYCFKSITTYLDAANNYEDKFISGFSDGGTGSYKIFYDNIEQFGGLIIFNGYPQHNNFNRTVDYIQIQDKRIALFSTFDDKVIPYEFLLTEYRKQKETNCDTYLYVRDGGHTFAEYEQKDFNVCFGIITGKVNNTKHDITHGYIENDNLIEFYKFRKSISKKFGYGEEYLKENKEQEKVIETE